MNILQRLHRDERATLIDWLMVLVGLLMLVIAYAIAIPLGNIFIKIFVENGAPLAQMLWIRTTTIWGFALFGCALMMIGFMSSYRKTYDQGQVGYEGWTGR